MLVTYGINRFHIEKRAEYSPFVARDSRDIGAVAEQGVVDIPYVKVTRVPCTQCLVNTHCAQCKAMQRRRGHGWRLKLSELIVTSTHEECVRNPDECRKVGDMSLCVLIIAVVPSSLFWREWTKCRSQSSYCSALDIRETLALIRAFLNPITVYNTILNVRGLNEHDKHGFKRAQTVG